MDLPNPSQYSYSKQPEPSQRKPFWVFGLSGLILISVVIGVFVLFKSDNKIVTPINKIVQPNICQASTKTGNYQKGTSPYPVLDWPNNKIGVYSYADSDSLQAAGKMINSNGGDWGWVLLPFNIKQLNPDTWNQVMASLCQYHLIPVLQLFNESKPPTSEETEKMAAFLGTLKWPTKLKFVTAYNEVNASEYWGGKIDPESYAQVLDKTITELKKRDKNFFVMNGAFNSSARTNPGFKTDLGVFTAYLDLPEYLDRMDKAVPGIFKKIDGWASHTYPHPAYKGKPSDTQITGESEYEAGRNTIRSYQYDLRLLKDKFGATPPVFITETGWPHREGTTIHNEWLPAETVASYYESAFKDLYLSDDRVIAVMPFIMKMKGVDNFSFIDSFDKPYPQYQTILDLPKTAGAPVLN